MDKKMNKIANQITMLGTGNATVSQIYNTCFLLQTSSTLKQKTEESFRKKLVKEKSRNALASELGIVKSEIEELEHIKKQ